MADLNIRNIDPELLKSIKVAAAQNGRTLRDEVLTRLLECAKSAGKA